jgi:hypothetical protein
LKKENKLGANEKLEFKKSRKKSTALEQPRRASDQKRIPTYKRLPAEGK